MIIIITIKESLLKSKIMYFIDNMFTLYSKPLNMSLRNLGIILVPSSHSMYFSKLSFLLFFCNSNHHSSSLVLTKLIYQTSCSYCIIMLIEVLSIDRGLLIKECELVTTVSIQNLIQCILQYGAHNWPQRDHNSYNG